MKLPSITYLTSTASRSLQRFPVTLFSALFAVVISIVMVELERDIENFFPWLNLALCGALGIPLFFAAQVFSESRTFSSGKRAMLYFAGLVALALIYFSFPSEQSTFDTGAAYIRYAVYAVAIHLIVAFIPFLGKGRLNAFWQYNRFLFVRFAISGLYSGFLFAGLALAVGSLDFLFDINLHEKIFADMFIFIGGFLNTWFFISGVPDDIEQLENDDQYPTGIKIFSQYVLLPLLIIYLIILYIYSVQIIALWKWPKGIVSYLVACVAVLGILTLLLIHPYAKQKGNEWIQKFSRIYYALLIPLVVLMFIAVGMRVSDYGITISRYAILLIGVWLMIVSIYFLLAKQNIKFIPTSLAAILLLSTFGFWGMFSVSERSQVNRLKSILENTGVLADGKILNEVAFSSNFSRATYPNDKKLSDSLHQEVYSILNYLDDFHGFSSLDDLFKQNADSVIRAHVGLSKENRSLNEQHAYMFMMGLNPSVRFTGNGGNLYFNYYRNQSRNRMTAITGNDYLLDLNITQSSSVSASLGNASDSTLTLTLDKTLRIDMTQNDHIELASFAVDSLAALLIKNKGENRNQLTDTEAILRSASKSFEFTFIINNLHLYAPKDGGLEVTRAEGTLLVRRKK